MAASEKIKTEIAQLRADLIRTQYEHSQTLPPNSELKMCLEHRNAEINATIDNLEQKFRALHELHIRCSQLRGNIQHHAIKITDPLTHETEIPSLTHVMKADIEEFNQITNQLVNLGELPERADLYYQTDFVETLLQKRREGSNTTTQEPVPQTPAANPDFTQTFSNIISNTLTTPLSRPDAIQPRHLDHQIQIYTEAIHDKRILQSLFHDNMETPEEALQTFLLQCIRAPTNKFHVPQTPAEIEYTHLSAHLCQGDITSSANRVLVFVRRLMVLRTAGVHKHTKILIRNTFNEYEMEIAHHFLIEQMSFSDAINHTIFNVSFTHKFADPHAATKTDFLWTAYCAYIRIGFAILDLSGEPDTIPFEYHHDNIKECITSQGKHLGTQNNEPVHELRGIHSNTGIDKLAKIVNSRLITNALYIQETIDTENAIVQRFLHRFHNTDKYQDAVATVRARDHGHTPSDEQPRAGHSTGTQPRKQPAGAEPGNHHQHTPHNRTDRDAQLARELQDQEREEHARETSQQSTQRPAGASKPKAEFPRAHARAPPARPTQHMDRETADQVRWAARTQLDMNIDEIPDDASVVGELARKLQIQPRAPPRTTSSWGQASNDEELADYDTYRPATHQPRTAAASRPRHAAAAAAAQPRATAPPRTTSSWGQASNDEELADYDTYRPATHQPRTTTASRPRHAAAAAAAQPWEPTQSTPYSPRDLPSQDPRPYSLPASEKSYYA